MNRANIIEIFSSIQGEGVYLGKKQVFVRFSCCNLACAYCDTDCVPGQNSYTAVELTEEILKLNEIPHHSVSLTGGEPLLHAAFLKEFLPMLKVNAPELKIYLETNGTLADKLQEVVSYVDIVAMDVKLESSTGQPMPVEEHKKFIEVLESQKKKYFLKAVFGADLQENEIEIVKNLVNEHIPLILQPITEQPIPQEKLFAIGDKFVKDVRDVRLIPQMHKYLGLR